jgi:hypothetical protein
MVNYLLNALMGKVTYRFRTVTILSFYILHKENGLNKRCIFTEYFPPHNISYILNQSNRIHIFTPYMSNFIVRES